MTGELVRWPHQRMAHASTIAAIEMGEKTILLTAPTGAGKSVMMTDLIHWARERSWRVVLYTNRKMLLDQLSGVLSKHGIAHGLRASEHQADLLSEVQISSIQTELARVYKSQKWGLHLAKLVIIDEAHNNCGDTAKRIIAEHAEKGAVVVGYTATPLGLADVYNKLIVAGTPSELRECGALVPCNTYGPDEPDTKSIKKLPSGEFSEKDVKKVFRIQQVFGRIFEWWKKLNPDARPTILFAPGVKESVWCAQQFEELGVRAAHIDGEDIYLDGKAYESDRPARDEVIEQIKDGRIKVVCNRFVLREGIDIPELYHAIFATVFGGLQSYLQSGGRVLRNHPSLPGHVIVQDHGGCLDTETEILTKRGWRGCDSIADDDIIGTMNTESGAFEWCPNEGTIRKRRDSGMKQLVSDHLNIRVTDYHTMVMRADLRRGSWHKVSASELATRRSNWIIPTAAIEDVTPCELTDSEIGFIGWFLTDGCMDISRIRIYQSGDAPREHHEHIVSCLEGCGFRYSRRERTRPSRFADKEYVEVSYSISSGRKSLGGWDRLSKWLDKSFPLEQFNKLDRRQFGVLLHALNLGDGLKQKNAPNTNAISVASDEVAGRLQSLAVRRGYRCNITKYESCGKFDSPINICRIRDSQMATVGAQEFSDSYVGFDERVWCVQTANGTIVTRRHGKVAIMGNSWHRHGSLNADREWELYYTNNIVTGLREQAMREKKEPEPIVCPKCGRVRQAGKQCPECNFESPKKTRIIMQVDGTLKEMQGDIYKPRRVKRYLGIEDDWKRMYFRGQNRCKKGENCTFVALEALFARENYWNFPPRDLPLMPRYPADWFRAVTEVPRDRLL